MFITKCQCFLNFDHYVLLANVLDKNDSFFIVMNKLEKLLKKILKNDCILFLILNIDITLNINSVRKS